jgi:hypothetical protein
LSKLLDIKEKDIEVLEAGIIRQAKYLKLSSSFLLKSFIVLIDLKKQVEADEVKIDRYTTKNLIIAKYKEEIINLYLDGAGYLKISNAIYLNHSARISKSSIENFIKQNNIKRDIESRVN